MDSRCYFNVERPNLLSEPASEADQLWQIGPFFVTLALAYVIGFLGFHWMVFGLVFWVFLNQYIHSAKEEERQYFRYWRNKKLTTRFWEIETPHWWNLFLYHLWPHMSTFLAKSTQNLLKLSLDQALAANKVYGVESLKVESVSFGATPVIFDNMETIQSNDVFVFDADVEYDGEGFIEMDLGLGGKLLNVRCPLNVQNFRIEGRMRFEIVFTTRYPFMYKLDCCFKQKPKVSMAINAHTIDVMSIPGLKESISTSVESAVHHTIVYPQKFSYVFNLWPEEGSPNIYGSKDLFDPFDETSELSQRLIIKMQPKIVSPIVPTYQQQGILHVYIIQAKGLQRAKRSITIDPYCVVKLDKKKAKTHVGNGKDPYWDRHFTFSFFRGLTQSSLFLTCYDNMIMQKDELLGIAQVDFNDILKTPGTPVNKWVELVTKKKTGDAGQVQIELVYQELLIESR